MLILLSGVWLMVLLSVSFFKFMFFVKHLLNSLLMLEFMVLSVYFFMVMFLGGKDMNYFFNLYYLIMAVCESALGLSVLVMVGCSHSSDSYKSMNKVLC